MAQWYLAQTLERVFREIDELKPERAGKLTAVQS
jgi:hypothetical protein